jgi:hypothetical protein
MHHAEQGPAIVNAVQHDWQRQPSGSPVLALAQHKTRPAPKSGRKVKWVEGLQWRRGGGHYDCPGTRKSFSDVILWSGKGLPAICQLARGEIAGQKPHRTDRAPGLLSSGCSKLEVASSNRGSLKSDAAPQIGFVILRTNAHCLPERRRRFTRPVQNKPRPLCNSL